MISTATVRRAINIYIASSQYCGSAGCHFEVFMQDEKDNYLPIELNLVTMKDIKISKTFNGLWREIFLETKKLYGPGVVTSTS